MEFFAENILLIFILPLISAIIAFTAHIFKYGISKKAVTVCTIISTLTGLFFSAYLSFLYSYFDAEPHELWLNSFRVGNLTVSTGIILDKLSTLFLFLIMITSLVVQIFAGYYMQDSKRYALYFCLLNLITITMEGFFLSTNLIQTYIFGAISGVMTYSLINFKYENKQNTNSANVEYITSKIGDFMLFAGIVVFMYFIANYPVSEGDILLSYSSLRDSASDFYVYLSDENFYIVCLLLFGGTIAKAVQFPLQTRFEKASQAELPSFILINSVLSIPAGIFLILRLMPFYELSEVVLNTIMYIGLFSGFISSLFALGQKDAKSTFAYISSAQAGITVAATATVLPSYSLVYLFTNILSITIFLLITGIIILFIKNDEHYENIYISKFDYPLLALCYLIATVSSAGMFFGGYKALYGIFSINIQNNSTGKTTAVLFFATVFLVAFAIFQSYFKIFGEKSFLEKKKIPIIMNFCLVLLTFLIVLINFYNFNGFNHLDNVVKEDMLSVFNTIPYQLIIVISAALLSCFFVVHRISFIPENIKNFALHGGYISSLYEKTLGNFIDILGNFTKGFDKYILNFNIAAYISRFISWCISVSQNGNVQTYISYALITTGIMLILYILLVVGFGVI